MEAMSRKHFQALANALQANLPDQNSNAFEREALLFENIADSIMRACAAFNPHFDRARFAKACGLEEIQSQRRHSEPVEQARNELAA
jgi:hypothetical protein